MITAAQIAQIRSWCRRHGGCTCTPQVTWTGPSDGEEWEGWQDLTVTHAEHCAYVQRQVSTSN